MVGHDCDAPVAVTVHDAPNGEDVRIPVVEEGVTIHERKDGPTSITRTADVTFPIESHGETWTDYISAYTEGGDIQRCTIEMKTMDENGEYGDDYTREFIGYISGVGSTGSANKGRLRVTGPYQLLKGIPAGQRLNNAEVLDVLSYVTGVFNEKQNIFDDVIAHTTQTISRSGEAALSEQSSALLDTDSEAFRNRDPEEGSGIVVSTNSNYRLIDEWTDSEEYTVTSKNFSANRDTLADVVKFLESTTPLKVFFTIVNGNLSLVALYQFYRTLDLTSDGDVPVISNDALYEMQPYNTLELVGGQGDVIDIGGFRAPIRQTNNTYYRITAEYDPLIERHGGNIKRRATSNLTNRDPLEEEAKSSLKSSLDEVSGGTITLPLHPEVEPYDRLVSQPACAGRINGTVPELTYEVERTSHTMAPSPPDENNISTTEVAVSMSVDIEDISVSVSQENAQVSPGTENEPPEQDPARSYNWDSGV